MDGVTTFLSTGWPHLDADLNGGLLSKTLTAIVAKPGMGTSTLVMNLCLHAAAAGHRCLLLTHDVRELCMAKMIASLNAPSDTPFFDEMKNAIKEFAGGSAPEQNKPFVIVFGGLDDAGECPHFILNRLKDYANFYNAAAVVTAHVNKNSDDRYLMYSYEMSNVMNCCDTVLLFEEDTTCYAMDNLSILKCRYSSACGRQSGAKMTLLPACARVYEIVDA